MFDSLIHALNLLATYKLSDHFFIRTEWCAMLPPSRFADGTLAVRHVRGACYYTGSAMR